jgi:Fusaric acid resistance protein-like
MSVAQNARDSRKTSQRKPRAAPRSPEGPGALRPRLWAGIVHSAGLASACLVSYWVVTELLTKAHSVSKTDDMLGGLWAVISTALDYRDTHIAALSRISATLLSFALCLGYLVITPFHPWGLALLVGAGAFLLALIGRVGDIVTRSITTAVVLVVAGLSPHDAWEQPILRLSDTVVGVAVGLGSAWAAMHVDPPHTS